MVDVWYITHLGMGQYLWIPFLVGWTSIYQLFWCSPGVQGFDTLPSHFPHVRYFLSTFRASKQGPEVGKKTGQDSSRALLNIRTGVVGVTLDSTNAFNEGLVWKYPLVNQHRPWQIGVGKSTIPYVYLPEGKVLMFFWVILIYFK